VLGVAAPRCDSGVVAPERYRPHFVRISKVLESFERDKFPHFVQGRPAGT